MTGQAKVCSWKPFHIFFCTPSLRSLSVIFNKYDRIYKSPFLTLSEDPNHIKNFERFGELDTLQFSYCLFVELKEMGILDSFIKAFYFGRNGGRWEELIAKIRFYRCFEDEYQADIILATVREWMHPSICSNLKTLQFFQLNYEPYPCQRESKLTFDKLTEFVASDRRKRVRKLISRYALV